MHGILPVVSCANNTTESILANLYTRRLMISIFKNTQNYLTLIDDRPENQPALWRQEELLVFQRCTQDLEIVPNQDLVPENIFI